MSRSTRQYAAHLAATGKPNLSAVVRGLSGPFQPPTIRPAAPTLMAPPALLRTTAREMRVEASRMLARANDLEAAAKRWEGE